MIITSRRLTCHVSIILQQQDGYTTQQSLSSIRVCHYATKYHYIDLLLVEEVVTFENRYNVETCHLPLKNIQ